MAIKQKNNSRLIAFGGIMAALSLVLMLLTAVIPVMDSGLPAICGFLTTLVVIECGEKFAGVCYGAVAILSLVLVPSKESAILYLILFGWYPIAKRRIEMLRKPVIEWVLKMCGVAHAHRSAGRRGLFRRGALSCRHRSVLSGGSGGFCAL